MPQIKSISVKPYNSEWLKQFDYEAELIQSHLNTHVITIHHIGSTSVADLAAKEDIDICLVIDNLKNSLALTNIGYIFKGEINLPLRYFFSKNTPFSKVNLHVVEADHHFLTLNLCFRDYLKTNDDARLAYQQLKTTLANNPYNFERIEGRFPRYTLEKHAFINTILDQAGYDSFGIARCTHYREWEAYYRIRNGQATAPTSIPWDPNHPSIKDPNHFHFVLLHGTIITAIAHVDYGEAHKAMLRALFVDTPFIGKGHDDYMLAFLKRWAAHHRHEIFKS